jgi:hypothetical protein
MADFGNKEVGKSEDKVEITPLPKALRLRKSGRLLY